MCFSNAFEAPSDTVCANMRQGNKLPIGHITARSVASRIHLQQVETALGERETLVTPHSGTNVFTGSRCSVRITTRRMKGRQGFTTAPLDTAMPLLYHIITLSSQVRSWSGTLDGTMHQPSASTSLQGPEQEGRLPVPHGAGAPAFLLDCKETYFCPIPLIVTQENLPQSC